MPDLLSIVWWRNFYARVGRWFGWGCMIVFGLPLVIGFGWNQYGAATRNNRGSGGNGVIAMVNGEPITAEQFLAAIPKHSNSDGESGAKQEAQSEGAAMDQLINATLVKELADKYKVKVSDADVDRRVKEDREHVLGKNATDEKWDEFLERYRGLSATDYRDEVAKEPAMLSSALLDKLKAMQVVTPDDLKRQNQEVQLRVVQIGYGRP
ncbi:MAG TPA: SurA N-terminal domain-containing protein, partial [Chthonomonadaceae bacterium]|nr:SurA N-terminal domain-containing protein [Chthonomonadaceae bacterium]